MREGPGDILVFLSGEREIRDTADALGRLALPGTELLPLYARLSAADQHRVFAPHRGRRVVLATNVAETSLTVPGIIGVVDPGTARISRYNRRTKVQRLPIEAISQASANQRAGRCGRIAPGTCIRLYSEEDFDARPEYTEPEILRTNLASVILQMAALGLGDVTAFPFVEPPDSRAIKDGILLLEELGAIDRGTAGDHVRLTKRGRQLARVPVDPRLARMVLEADRHGVVGEVLVLAAVLSIQDPRERPADQEQAAREHHQRFADPESDFIGFLNLWRYLREQQKARGSSQFRKMCQAEHLHHLRIREWQDVHSQLRQVVRGLRLEVRPLAEEPDRDGIHRSLLAGLLSHVGMLDADGNEYRGAREARFVIAPGSALGKRRPKWVMAAELVETNRLRARTVAQITPDRVEQAAGHLVTRSYEEPWWEEARGAAMTTERVSLYGLPLVTDRRVQLERVDPAEARSMFLRHALVDGDWDGHHAFVQANKERVAEVVALEERVRRDLLVSDEDLVAFFDARVPDDVTTARRFDGWWKRAGRDDPDRLTYAPSDLIEPSAGPVDRSGFPDTWPLGTAHLALTYVLDPTSDLDGVVVDVPLPLLDQVDRSGLDWQVPGRRHELVTALLRTLPKEVRRHLPPAPDAGDEPAGARRTGRRSAARRAGPGADGGVRVRGRAAPPRPGGDPAAPAGDLPRRGPGWATAGVEPRPARAAPADGRPRARGPRGLGPDRRGDGGHLVGVRHDPLDGLGRPRGPGRHAATPPSSTRATTVGLRVLPVGGRAARRDVGRHAPAAPAPARGRRSGPSTGRCPTDTKLALRGPARLSAADAYRDCAAAAVDQLLVEHGGPVFDADAFRSRLAQVRAGFAPRGGCLGPPGG